MLETICVCFLAGLGAGIGTGFAGLSAATVISPMLITFLGCPWYEAVGIGLASDVLASAAAARTYQRYGHIDLKNGRWMLISVLVMVLAGSYFSQYMPDHGMGMLSVAATFFMGIRFLIKPSSGKKRQKWIENEKTRKTVSLAAGGVIGFYCGFMGLGGGLLMLFILTAVLGYELKNAVGTSVFIMTFTALIGAAAHFLFGNIRPYLFPMLLCIFFTLLWSVLASVAANRLTVETAHRITGAVLSILGIVMLFFK